MDSVLNHCLIDRATNIRIGKQAPSVYLEEMRADSADPRRSARQPPAADGTDSPLATDDFEAFLEWREQALDEALAAVTGRGPAGAGRSPERSSLDMQVEGVELELRRIVADTPRRRGRRTATPREPENQRAHRHRATPEPGHGKRPLRPNGRQAGILASASSRSSPPRRSGQVRGTVRQQGDAGRPLCPARRAAEWPSPQQDGRRVTRKDGEAALIWFRQVLAHG